MTPELTTPFLTSTQHQRDDVLASTYLKYIGPSGWRVFGGSRLEVMTRRLRPPGYRRYFQLIKFRNIKKAVITRWSWICGQQMKSSCLSATEDPLCKGLMNVKSIEVQSPPVRGVW
ncbi:hypothetical protein TNCV_244181 [Trichonephila clavipes]|uniref:Uncharacterized protein n=1 Tax=Trichonephila clavipes TaxID=2585209 RepID=A0A8X6UXK5_TRICX|nr:hypothetical protein TNCV_244181 [Trichonephila clavipes]